MNSIPSYTEITRTPPGTTSYVDESLPDGHLCYRVRAFNALGLSTYSSEACGTADGMSSGVALTAALLPSSRSVPVGSSATALATVINLSAGSATGCGIVMLTSVPATFHYQTTNPATNAITGQPDTPVDIAGAGSQTFLLTFVPTAPFAPTDVQLEFDCSNAQAAAVVSGLNTLLLSASAPPVPDIVALAATLNNDGIVNVPGASGTGTSPWPP